MNRGFGDKLAIGDFANYANTVINSSPMSTQSRKHAKNNDFDLLLDEKDGSCEDITLSADGHASDDDDSI